jgi:hypothetical protein
MKNTIKVFGIIALVAIIGFSMTACDDDPGGGNGNGEKTYGDFTYTVSGNSVTITFYNGSGGSVTIPAEIDGKPVTVIGNSAFVLKQLTSVTIPGSVTSIGYSAFAGNQLTSVTIPNSVTSIGHSAFRENQLGNVTIPNGITTIGETVFADNQLTSVTIPNGVETIGNGAFESNQLSSVTIPNTVTDIKLAAFHENQLTSITIGADVTFETDVVGYFAFGNFFESTYNEGGKLAGTYTRPDTSSNTWTKN